MKNQFIRAIVLILIASSCSSPRYSYNFSYNTVPAAKQKKMMDPILATTPSTTSQTVQETYNTAVSEEMTTLASVKENYAIPSASRANTEKKIVARSLSGKERKTLISRIKVAVKDYKKDAKGIAPDSAAAEGKKSQLVALLLAIFLGALGIHRFYLGRIWTGLVQVLLLVTAFLVAPLYILGIWVLIDIILIAIGKLTPKSGPYDTTL